MLIYVLKSVQIPDFIMYFQFIMKAYEFCLGSKTFSSGIIYLFIKNVSHMTELCKFYSEKSECSMYLLMG